jgi:uncharacterized RDD family membrane protein YckC
VSYQDPNDPWGQQPGSGQEGWGQQQPGYGQQPGWNQPPPGYDPYPSTPGSNQLGGPVLAGWWYRVGATVIDSLIVGVVNVIISIALFKAGVAVYVVAFAISVIYAGLMIGSQGRTVGMMALGTTVVDAGTGGPIGYGRAFGRAAIYAILPYLLLIPWLLDVLWPLWDDRNQTLHDKAVSSLVILNRR